MVDTSFHQQIAWSLYRSVKSYHGKLTLDRLFKKIISGIEALKRIGPFVPPAKLPPAKLHAYNTTSHTTCIQYFSRNPFRLLQTCLGRLW